MHSGEIEIGRINELGIDFVYRTCAFELHERIARIRWSCALESHGWITHMCWSCMSGLCTYEMGSYDRFARKTLTDTAAAIEGNFDHFDF
ncbi:hypothetical protein PAJ34TS1_56800 [Paenibacillus azoreducens]|uniref:Uncharacterized protein n=1 Tax=Paenibacillus azoreducens TaxID=116718 RepID=A0A919YEG3_9BACL|nr:hypothetical protein J34TS1_20450 [Paenibacillus azoreducens]